MARRAVRLVEQIILPQDRSTYETTLSNYTAGRATFIDLLDTERALIEARLDLDAARRDANRALLRLAEVAGQISVHQ